jgi:hypothetical protein
MMRRGDLLGYACVDTGLASSHRTETVARPVRSEVRYRMRQRRLEPLNGSYAR